MLISAVPPATVDIIESGSSIAATARIPGKRISTPPLPQSQAYHEAGQSPIPIRLIAFSVVNGVRHIHGGFPACAPPMPLTEP
jgi:hypothetical protein